MIRLAGTRTFGVKSAFDKVVVIMLGAILSRSVVGASTFISIITAAIVFCLIRRIIAYLTWKNHRVGVCVKGNRIVLFKKGKLIEKIGDAEM